MKKNGDTPSATLRSNSRGFIIINSMEQEVACILNTRPVSMCPCNNVMTLKEDPPTRSPKIY